MIDICFNKKEFCGQELCKKTFLSEGIERAKLKWYPNSIYIQRNTAGDIKTISYYDERRDQFSHEDYIQDSRHYVTIDGKRYNLKKHPHEHQKKALTNPTGDRYYKYQVRILNHSGMPITRWANSGKPHQ